MTLLHRFPEKLAVLTLGPGADIPSWAESSSILSVTATATETSIITAGRNVPSKVPGDRGLLGFVTAGVEAPGDPGLLVALLAPLVEVGVAVHVVTTPTVAWLLVDSSDLDRAVGVWEAHGHTVEPAPTEPDPTHQTQQTRQTRERSR